MSTTRSDFDQYNAGRQATIKMAAQGYGWEDVVVKLAALRLPANREWVKWWVLHNVSTIPAKPNTSETIC